MSEARSGLFSLRNPVAIALKYWRVCKDSLVNIPLVYGEIPLLFVNGARKDGCNILAHLTCQLNFFKDDKFLATVFRFHPDAA